MKDLPEEIISEILELADVKTLKDCRLVCAKWRRICTPIIFRQAVYHGITPTSFIQIITHFSAHIKIILIEISSATSLLYSIVAHDELRLLVLRPTVGVIRQHHQGEIITTLTDMKLIHASAVLPALKEIRFISTDAPYLPMRLFSKLRKIQIDMETIQLRADDTWPLLEELLLRGTIDIDPLEAFLSRHEHLKRLHIAAVLTLRPLEPSEGDMHGLLRSMLGKVLSADLVDSVLSHTTEHAISHERSLFQHVYTRLEEITNEETVKKVRRTVVQVFEQLMKLELERYCTEIGKMHVQTKISNQLELICSIETFWKDELAIKGTKFTDESKDGLWINDGVREMLGISYVFKRRTS